MYNILISLIIFITFILIAKFSNIFKYIPNNIKTLIPFWHLFFTFVYYLQSLSSVIDVNFFFERSLAPQKFVFFGSKFIFFITSLFSQNLNFSFFNTFFIFSLFGYIGILFFAESLFYLLSFNSNKFSNFLVKIIVFFPSLHFWSSAIGKDSLMFLAVGLMVWSGIKMNSRKLWFLLSFIGITIIRPHVGFLLFVSIYLNTLFKSNLNINKYFKFFIYLAPLLLLTTFPILLVNYFKIESLTFSGIINYLELRTEYTTTGNLALEIKSLNPLMRPFIFLYGPILLRGLSLFEIIIFFENIFLLLLTFFSLRNLLKYKFDFKNNPNFLFFYFPIFTLTLLSFSVGNIGIALRQKWMIIPFLYVYLIKYIHANKNIKILNKSQ